MNYKHNVGFFTKTDMPKYVGIALVILGVVLFYYGWGYISYVLLCISLPLGIGLFIFGSSRRCSEEDLDSCIEVSMRDLDPRLDEDKKYAKKLHRQLAPMTADGYEYREGVMLAKGKDGTLRSSEYTASIIYTLNDGLHITRRAISLIEDKAEDSVLEVKFDSVESVRLVRGQAPITFRDKTYNAPICRLHVKCTDTEYITPIKDNISSEEYVEKLGKVIDAYKRANQHQV